MRAGTDSWGYTIVEVMIFLAISGMMFVLAAGFISGKQARAEFKQGMNDTNIQIQQVVSDVSNGFYASLPAGYRCWADNTVGGTVHVDVGANDKGGCTFIGKVIQFGTDKGPANYNVYSVVGRQYKGTVDTAELPTTLDEAKPTADAKLIDHRTFPNGITVAKVFERVPPGGATTKSLNGFGFFNSFNGGGVQTSPQSGSQTLSAVVIPGTPPLLAEAEPNMVSDIGTSSKGASVFNTRPTPDITVCLDSGSGQWGTLNIGGNNGQRLSTSIHIFNTKPPECL